MVEVIGREAELAAGKLFLDAVESGLAVCVFEGEPGIGKTTVWSVVVDLAAERGFRVLTCRPAEAERSLSLAAVTDLLASVSDPELENLPTPQRRAIDAALLRIDPGEHTADRRALAMGTLSLVRTLAAQGPVVLALDDIQWLDADTAAVVDFVSHRIQPNEPIGLLLARRSGEPMRLDLNRLIDPSLLSRVAIGPMTLAAMHHLLERNGGAPSRSTLVKVHGASGGNPLFALEITRAVRATDQIGAGEPLPVPDDLQALLSERVRSLSTDAREALLAVAALSAPSLDTVARASSPSGLEAAEESGLLRRYEGRLRFAHPLYASAVYAAVSTRRRRDMHKRLAELVDDQEEHARHLALADPGGKNEEVATRLEQAAIVARARGAWESAADLLEQASAFTPEDRLDAGRERMIRSAEHRVRGGDLARARTMLERVLDEPLGRNTKAQALSLLAEITYNHLGFLQAKQLYQDALSNAEDPRLVVTIELGLEYVDVVGGIDFDEGVRYAEQALEHAEAIGDRGLIAVALAFCEIAKFHAGRGVDWAEIERSLALEDPDRPFAHAWRPSLIAAALLFDVGDHEESRRRMKAIRAEATEQGDEGSLAFVLAHLALIEAVGGDLTAALAAAEEAETLARLNSSAPDLAWGLAVRAYVLAVRGDIEDARRACDASADTAQKAGIDPKSIVGGALGEINLSLGDADAAWRACQPLVEALEQTGVREPAYVLDFIPEAIRALIALGELERAERLIDAVDQRARVLDRASALGLMLHCRGLLLAARGEVARAAEVLDEALAYHDRVDMPFYRAQALLTRGSIQRRMRRRADAKRSFEEALLGFEAIGAKLWAERARQELARLGLRRSAGADLTENERRVAELAAEGRTNREIAELMFISPKTVEANLSAIYRKLGIRSRAQLGSRMAQSPQT